jgi:hypothetical protein
MCRRLQPPGIHALASRAPPRAACHPAIRHVNPPRGVRGTHREVRALAAKAGPRAACFLLRPGTAGSPAACLSTSTGERTLAPARTLALALEALEPHPWDPAQPWGLLSSAASFVARASRSHAVSIQSGMSVASAHGYARTHEHLCGCRAVRAAHRPTGAFEASPAAFHAPDRQNPRRQLRPLVRGPLPSWRRARPGWDPRFVGRGSTRTHPWLGASEGHAVAAEDLARSLLFVAFCTAL